MAMGVQVEGAPQLTQCYHRLDSAEVGASAHRVSVLQLHPHPWSTPAAAADDCWLEIGATGSCCAKSRVLGTAQIVHEECYAPTSI